jgi:hypothetical protein
MAKDLTTKGAQAAQQEVVRAPGQAQIPDPGQGTCPQRTGAGRSKRDPGRAEGGQGSGEEEVPEQRQEESQEAVVDTRPTVSWGPSLSHCWLRRVSVHATTG